MVDIQSPLRLAVGSHSAGSGKGCAMNVVSWENGDQQITDYPACAHRALARMVQSVNDSICTHRDGDLLCPACSVQVLDLAHRTVGTSSATREQVWAWLSELLDSDWGVIRCAKTDKARSAIGRVAELCGQAARGEMAPAEVWREARKNAAAAADDVASYAAASYAYASYAYAAYAYAADAAAAAADVAYADAAAAAAYAAAAAAYAAEGGRLAFAHLAVDAWERLTGSASPEVDIRSVQDAYNKMIKETVLNG